MNTFSLGKKSNSHSDNSAFSHFSCFQKKNQVKAKPVYWWSMVAVCRTLKLKTGAICLVSSIILKIAIDLLNSLHYHPVMRSGKFRYTYKKFLKLYIDACFLALDKIQWQIYILNIIHGNVCVCLYNNPQNYYQSPISASYIYNCLLFSAMKLL